MQGALLLIAWQAAEPQSRPNFTPEAWWLWILVALVIVAAIAWLLRRVRLGGPWFPGRAEVGRGGRSEGGRWSRRRSRPGP